MKLKKLNQEGFTLVELMVVVAIVGILVAVAIPQYQKYQARSRQTEAKIALGGVFTAEQSFSVENSSYTGCLNDIGVASQGNQLYYSVGFKAAPTGTTCGPTGALACNASAWNISAGTNVACSGNNLGGGVYYAPIAANSFVKGAATGVAVYGSIPTSTTVTQGTFIAGAVGNISSSVAGDSWTIDNTKTLTNSTAGI